MTDLYHRASDRFERVIATATPSIMQQLPILDAFLLDALQIQLASWEERQPFWSASVLPVALGIGEECGELASANGHDDVVDAIGDIAIYACQVATRERLAMSVLIEAADRIWPRRDLLSTLGRFNHLVLKRHQKIREGALPDAEYRALLADALAELMAAARIFGGASVAECFAATAPTVLARDWTADRAGGGQ